ncbi:MAG TPA: hypothetical protein VHA80_05580 [Solirubrobacterales bacterium]|nr:hypothetical protein [Solirubrobacterales bacterium]
MELITGMTGELPGPYVECPEEGCAYTLAEGRLMRHRRDADLVLRAKPIAVDPEADAPEHERPRLRRIVRLLREGDTAARLASPFVVFVPRAGEGPTAGILPGSGIVGAPVPGHETVVVHHEGARPGQVGMTRLADRVFHAHGRLARRYPSVTRKSVPRVSLVEVGTYDPAAAVITPIDAIAEAALAAWLGEAELDPAELVRGGGAA